MKYEHERAWTLLQENLVIWGVVSWLASWHATHDRSGWGFSDMRRGMPCKGRGARDNLKAPEAVWIDESLAKDASPAMVRQSFKIPVLVSAGAGSPRY